MWLAIRADPPYLPSNGRCRVAVAGQVAADLDFRVQPRKDLAQHLRTMRSPKRIELLDCSTENGRTSSSAMSSISASPAAGMNWILAIAVGDHRLGAELREDLAGEQRQAGGVGQQADLCDRAAKACQGQQLRQAVAALVGVEEAQRQLVAQPVDLHFAQRTSAARLVLAERCSRAVHSLLAANQRRLRQVGWRRLAFRDVSAMRPAAVAEALADHQGRFRQALVGGHVPARHLRRVGQNQ